MSQDIKQNVQNVSLPNQTCIFLDVLASILGPGAYFAKPIVVLKPWAQAGQFEYHAPSNQNNFFFSYTGCCRFLKSRTPQLKPLEIEIENTYPKTFIIYYNNYYQPFWNFDFFNVHPALLCIPVQTLSVLKKTSQELSLVKSFIWIRYPRNKSIHKETVRQDKSATKANVSIRVGKNFWN